LARDAIGVKTKFIWRKKVHFHIFALETVIGPRNQMENVTRTYSRESVIETGELIKDLLRDKQIHIEQVMRCERKIEPGKQVWDCELVVATETIANNPPPQTPIGIQERADGYHYHVKVTNGERIATSSPCCEHQAEYLVRNASDRGHYVGTIECRQKLGDDHQPIDECSCGFGALLY
jgi:hypothetical protein